MPGEATFCTSSKKTKKQNENHGAQPTATDNASAHPLSVFKVSGSACLTRNVRQKYGRPV